MNLQLGVVICFDISHYDLLARACPHLSICRHNRPGECICPPEFTGPHCEFLKVLVEKQHKPHSILESEGVKPQEHGSRPDRNNYVPLLLLGLVSITTLIFSIWWRKKNKSNHVHNQVTHGRHLNHPSSVFPLSPLGYTSDNNFYHDGESDDEFSFQDVALT